MHKPSGSSLFVGCCFCVYYVMAWILIDWHCQHFAVQGQKECESKNDAVSKKQLVQQLYTNVGCKWNEYICLPGSFAALEMSPSRTSTWRGMERWLQHKTSRSKNRQSQTEVNDIKAPKCNKMLYQTSTHTHTVTTWYLNDHTLSRPLNLPEASLPLAPP